MASGLPRQRDFKPSQEQEPAQKIKPVLGILPAQHLFGFCIVLLFAVAHWPIRWLFSGAPILTYILLQGAANGQRILPFIPVWPLIGVLNLAYAVAGTSWLLYWIFVGTCYPVIMLASLYQFDSAARFARRSLRKVLRELQFTKDVIALFDLPALEIDVDVEGLMCVRGITFSLSTLTVVAYGIEVGIKFSDDMEVAIVVDEVTVRLFRRIDISDVYANVKGGEYEMTFKELAQSTKDEQGRPLMIDRSASLTPGETPRDISDFPHTPMTEEMTGGRSPLDVSVDKGLKGTKRVFPDDQAAASVYKKALDNLRETSAIAVALREAKTKIKSRDGLVHEVLESDKDLRAAICSCLHSAPTIPHPATKKIRVSDMQKMDKYGIRKFCHRFPMGLRMLLMPVSYFHPVFIDSISAGGSGMWIKSMLVDMVFKNRSEDDIAVKNLRKRVQSWLSDANFVFQTTKITGVAYVPFNTQYDILNTLAFDDIMAYRTLPAEIDLTRIVRLGGADARISVPSFLLPHHEHLLPPKPTQEDKDRKKQEVEDADDGPKTVQAEHELEQTQKDETSITISTHVKLPAFFDQELLDFISALVKATKIVEIQTDGPSLADVSFEESKRHGLRELSRALKSEVKHGMTRVAIDAAANDKWIAKLVGKLTRKLEVMQGDVGYSGDLPIKLQVYREKADPASKFLP